MPEMLARTRVTKLFVSDQLTLVVKKAMDLMGAFGYAREGDLEKHWPDSKIMSLWMGGRALPQLHIARWVFRRPIVLNNAARNRRAAWRAPIT
jgi:butyryl-CoA dehydrogenase